MYNRYVFENIENLWVRVEKVNVCAVYFLTDSNMIAAHTIEGMQTYTGQVREGIGSRKLVV